MSDWVEKLNKLNKNSVNKRSFPGGAWNAATFLMQRDNVGINQREILDAVHEDPVFYSCLSLIASKIAATDIYPVNSEGEIERDHPLQELIDNPNSFHSKFTFLWLLSVYLLATGSCYLYVQADGSVLPLSNRQITHRGGKDYLVKLWSGDSRQARLGDNLAKIRLPDVREPYLSGAGYGTSLGGEIDISRAAREHESSVLHNNARPDMLVNFEGINEEQLAQVRNSWNSTNRGPKNSGKTAFSNGGGLDVKTLNTSFQDLGFIDLRQYSADVKRRTFGIPPELLGQVENSNRATIEAAFYLFAKNVLEPKLKLILSSINSGLLPLLDDVDDVKLDCEDVVPENKDRKLSAMEKFPKAFSINEARRAAGYKPVEGGDVSLASESDSLRVLKSLHGKEKQKSRSRKKLLKEEIPALNSGIPEDIHLYDLTTELNKKQEKSRG